MTRNWIDQPRIRNGIRRMLDARSELTAAGDEVIGWKLGFGAPNWLEEFSIPGPLVGFLPASRRHEPGARIPVDGWTRPVAEPELAVHFGSEVTDPDDVAGAISSIAPAIELADVDPPPDDLEEVLAGNIFHRAVIIGDPDPTRAGGDISGLEAHVSRDGEEIAVVSDLEALTGELVAILRHTASLLSVFGERIRPGEVVITGSVIPPVSLSPGEEIEFRLHPLSPVSVRV